VLQVIEGYAAVRDGFLGPLPSGCVERVAVGWAAELFRGSAGAAHSEWPIAPGTVQRIAHRTLGSAASIGLPAGAKPGTQWHAWLTIVRDAREKIPDAKRAIRSEAHNAWERVPLRAKRSFQADPLIETHAVCAVPWLAHLQPWYCSSQVAAEALGRPRVVASLFGTPLSP
jgi:HPt (histidine-containing phosphotransfer) domain-containing protein